MHLTFQQIQVNLFQSWGPVILLFLAAYNDSKKATLFSTKKPFGNCIKYQ